MNTDSKITRREALKRMGVMLASTAITSSGIATLAGCTEQRRKRVIFYFTGTGNCLHVARELADENTELLSIPQLMKEGRYNFHADEIGLVYPVYGHMPPYMVRQFINRAHLEADYKFAILTYGNRKCSSVEIWDDISRRAGNPFDYIATLIMVDNWLPNFDMNEQMKIDKHIPENLERIRGDLRNRIARHEPVSDLERSQHAEFMQRSGLSSEAGFVMQSKDYFVVTDACIGCGVCASVCPRGNYKLTSGGVKTEGDCEFCFACIQNCPQKAIRFAETRQFPFLQRGEINPNARYRNENISLMDIKRANNQF